jgi:hypothetical protein
MKKTTQEQYRKKCVTAAKFMARKLANFTCEYCGKREPDVKTHGSHIYSEGTYKSMSADLNNIICLCFTHHTGGWNANQPSWHKNPMEMTEWFRTKYPERANELRIKAQKTYVYNWEELWTEHFRLLNKQNGQV